MSNWDIEVLEWRCRNISENINDQNLVNIQSSPNMFIPLKLLLWHKFPTVNARCQIFSFKSGKTFSLNQFNSSTYYSAIRNPSFDVRLQKWKKATKLYDVIFSRANQSKENNRHRKRKKLCPGTQCYNWVVYLYPIQKGKLMFLCVSGSVFIRSL